MPIVVFVLGVAVFAQGTSEFMLSGLLEPVAAATGVSLGAAGLLTSLFAVGMIVGAPLMAMAAGRWPVRHALTGFLSLFLAAHVIGALTTTFTVLLLTRVVAAVANAGFLAVALAALPALVGPHRVGRATSVILSGITLACIVGVPAGAFLGQALGWQAAFWAIALVSAPALAATWPLVRTPVDQVDESDGSIRQEWRTLGNPRVRAILILGALVNAATFAAFTYLGALTTGAGASPAWVPVVLALFGIGSFAGVTLSGRYADRHAQRIVQVGTITLLASWSTTALLAGSLPGLLVLTTLGGTLSFAVGSTLIGLAVRAATPTAPRLSGAFATAALNLGAAAGPALAGLTITATGTPTAALWISAALAATATTTALLHPKSHTHTH
ncbi:Cmx/CmrA family chloramphenicol efflux MFS transporter [Nocardia altamirensis]|uniref:Cmx/CmrA family chloramphenicol efflux MFS transporter n=1 Tax=Nocardia altamirensis TaxID=472158 RepID=UPI000840837B|nr:Cmx/CmrA family chloramphenicol efflux MFS transporter [Nocardia altamirensis]